MNKYSSREHITHFIARITEQSGRGERPAFVNDLDGNLLVGYSLADSQSLPLGPLDNPANQAIPFGSTPAQLREWVRQGILVEGIFAEKPMDARLPVDLVDRVNGNVRDGRPFDIAFLTSRSAADAVVLLRESGVERPEQVTLIADSGATLYFHGAKRDVRVLSSAEHDFLFQIDTGIEALTGKVLELLSARGLDTARCPNLYIETKGIAKNVHYRAVLMAYGQPEGSDLDQHIGGLVKAELRKLVENGPQQADGSQTFQILDGPATVEVTVAGINKGDGLYAIAEAAAQYSPRPTAVIFTGDDVSKGNGTPGTDYFAMIRAPEVAEQYGIPVYTIHTLHPLGGRLDGLHPDERKSVLTLSEHYPAPRIDLCVPTPQALAGVILLAHDTAREKELAV